MKTKITIMMLLVVMFLPSFSDSGTMEQYLQRSRETDFLRRQQRMFRGLQEEQKPFIERESTKERITQLEARIIALENAFATRLPLSREGIPRNLRRRFDGELKLQSDKAVAAVQGRVRSRVIGAINE